MPKESKCDQFGYALTEEDNREDDVDISEHSVPWGNVIDIDSLRVVGEREQEGVQQNDKRDESVEPFPFDEPYEAFSQGEAPVTAHETALVAKHPLAMNSEHAVVLAVNSVFLSV